MYKNLEAELARQGITKRKIAESKNWRYATIVDKLNGKSKISLDEAYEIRDTFFPGMSIEYLFQKTEGQGKTN